MLDKWDYSCNKNLSCKKSFASTKLWNKIKLHINLYIMGCPFSMYTIISMYTEILSYSRATNICWMQNNPDGTRAFSRSLLRYSLEVYCNSRTQSPALFQNIFKSCTFLAKFPNILPFFNIFLPFFLENHMHSLTF